MPLTLKNFNSTGGGGWTPGANTIIYYDFENNVNDQSGNNRDATASGTISYGTHYVDLTSGKLLIPNLSYANDMTILFWIKCNASSNTGFIFDVINSGQNKMIVRYQGTQMTSNYPSDAPYTFAYSKNWMLWVSTYSSSGIKYYVNGSLMATKTAWSTAPGTAGGSYIGAGWNGAGGNPQLYAGHFIIENKARTAQEISDYYDLTKGDYGLGGAKGGNSIPEEEKKEEKEQEKEQVIILDPSDSSGSGEVLRV